MSVTSNKSDLQSLNSYMLIALISLFLTGLGLLILAIILLLRLADVQNLIGFEISFLNGIVVTLIMVGVILILLGVFQSMGLMSRIKKFLDKAIATGSIGVSAPVQVIHTSASSSAAPANAGLGVGLNIIRPPMPKASEEATEVAIAPKPKAVVVSTPKPVINTAAPNSNPVPSKTVEASTPTAPAVGGMDLDGGLKFIIDRYNSDKVKPSFKGWVNTLMMTFKDLGKSYLFIINGDQGLEFKEGKDDTAAVQVTMDSQIFLKMMNKQINPIKAYSSGGLEVKGEMKNMLKLKKLMF